MKKPFLHSTFYILHSIFKRGIAVLILFVLSVFLGAPVAYAENEKLRVYYSEPIGAGEKVYHFTACNWVRAYEPLVCSGENAEEYSAQCKYKEGDKKGKVKKGTRIMGCVKKDAVGSDAYEDEAKMYLNANVEDYDAKKCKDDPVLQGYKYGPVWAIVDHLDGDAPAYKWIMKGTVATQNASTKPSDAIIKEIYEVGDVNNAYPYYKTNLCATWDVLLSGETDDANISYEDEVLINKVLLEDTESIPDNLIKEGCNNDNSKEALPINENGVPEPLVHCSLVERITGDTGTDVFSQYVGALYKWAAGIVGIVTVLIMVFSGIQISMAGGDSAKIDSAKNRIMQSIIGLVILFLAGLILYTINPGFFIG